MIKQDEDGRWWLLIDPRRWCKWCERKRKGVRNGYHPECAKQMQEIEAQKRSGAIHET